MERAERHSNVATVVQARCSRSSNTMKPVKLLKIPVDILLRGILGWPLRFLIHSPDPSYEQKLIIDAQNDFRDIIIRAIKRPFSGKSDRRSVATVEKNYDRRLAVKAETINVVKARPSWYLIDGKPVLSDWNEFRPHSVRMMRTLVGENKFGSVLEVGGGELTWVSVMAEALGGDSDFYSVDLSFARCLQASRLAVDLDFGVSVAKANAAQLPFADSSIDLVYSHHALEQMPSIYKDVLDEMFRVARKRVIILEPSYELGDLRTKLKIRCKNYVIGIDPYLEKRYRGQITKGILPTQGNPASLTAYHLVDLDTEAERSAVDPYACPVCHEPLLDKSGFDYCRTCKLAFNRIEQVRNLDPAYAVAYYESDWINGVASAASPAISSAPSKEEMR